MLVRTLDGQTLHVLVKEKEVLYMDDDANLTSTSLGAFLYGLKNGIFTELK